MIRCLMVIGSREKNRKEGKKGRKKEHRWLKGKTESKIRNKKRGRKKERT